MAPYYACYTEGRYVWDASRQDVIDDVTCSISLSLFDLLLSLSRGATLPRHYQLSRDISFMLSVGDIVSLISIASTLSEDDDRMR